MNRDRRTADPKHNREPSRRLSEADRRMITTYSITNWDTSERAGNFLTLAAAEAALPDLMTPSQQYTIWEYARQVGRARAVTTQVWTSDTA